MHRMSSFLFISACHFVLFVFKKICIFMQKTHANFISKEQLMAPPSLLWRTAHVTPCGRITSVSSLPSPQHCSTHTALQQQDAALTTAIIKKKLKIKNQNPKTAVNSCHLISKRIHQS